MSALALQSVGGAMGNMVAIHNIVAVCSVLGLANVEGVILKKTAGTLGNGTYNNDITLTGSTNGEISGGLPFTFSNLTKSGNNTWTLGGTVCNTGTTAINLGTLFINGNHSTAVGNVTVAANATLGGTGTAITGITITAKDASNNTATGFTVTFGGTGGFSGGFSGTSANFTGGVLSGVGVTPTVAGSDLTFTVDDGAGHTGSTVIATIQSVYDEWSGGDGFTTDSNNDGVPNGVAWALGSTDPTANATTLLPTTDNTSDSDYLIYTFRRSDAANAAASIACQYGSDLASDWTTAVDDETNVIITESDNFYGASPGTDKVEVKIRRTQATGGKIFTRLRVTPNP